jgi:hypothetical protein
MVYHWRITSSLLYYILTFIPMGYACKFIYLSFSFEYCFFLVCYLVSCFACNWVIVFIPIIIIMIFFSCFYPVLFINKFSLIRKKIFVHDIIQLRLELHENFQLLMYFFCSEIVVFISKKLNFHQLTRRLNPVLWPI